MADRSANGHGPELRYLAVNAGKHNTIHGGQYNYTSISTASASHPNLATRLHAIHAPRSQTQDLSPLSLIVLCYQKEIASKLEESCEKPTLAHALAVTGLGGMGKTQLVLHYAEKHRSRYDTILWIDAHDRASILSSYQGCCTALSISLEEKSMPARLQDAEPVQKLRQWLASRGKDQKWLVIFDNADNLSEIDFVIPSNESAGSVIVTSQDGKAGRHLKAKTTAVDKMNVEEAKTLLAACTNLESFEDHLILSFLLEELSNRLDGIALAIDLAGARIRDDLENMPEMYGTDENEAAVGAVKQYLIDLAKQKRSVLSSSEYSGVSAYKKTIWTVWETVLDSLERTKQSDAGCKAFPLHLLKLAALLGPRVVHREVFRSASQSLHEVCAEMKADVELPQWFKCLLELSDDSTWDTFAYRASMSRLLRFHLVHSTTEEVFNISKSWDLGDPMKASWPGFAMHGLVRWRTVTETTEREYEVCRSILVAAACRTNSEYHGGLDFRVVLKRYLPRSDHVWQLQHLTQKGMADLFLTFGTTYSSVLDFVVAKHFLLRAHRIRRTVLGAHDPATIEIGAELHMLEGLESIGEEENGFTDLCKSAAYYGSRLSPVSVSRECQTKSVARFFGHDMMWPVLMTWIRPHMSSLLDPSDGMKHVNSVPDAIRSAREKAQEVISLLERELEAATTHLGKSHRDVITLKFNLARIRSFCIQYEAARGQLEALVPRAQQRFGEKHCVTLQIMERLAICQWQLEQFGTAQRAMENVVQLSRVSLGDDDPRTQLRISHVASLEENMASSKVQEQDARSNEGLIAQLRELYKRKDSPSFAKQLDAMMVSKTESERITIINTIFMDQIRSSRSSDAA